MKFIIEITKNLLSSIYRDLGAALIISVLFMAVKMYSDKIGWKNVWKEWIISFKGNLNFRKQFFYSAYIAIMLLRTLLCRSIYTAHPLSSIIGVWGIYNSKGEFSFDSIENIILFIPYTLFGFIVVPQLTYVKGTISTYFGHIHLLSRAVFFSLTFSILIESIQLFLKIGTFQLSDLVFNALGGAIGGVLYCCYLSLKMKNK